MAFGVRLPAIGSIGQRLLLNTFSFAPFRTVKMISEFTDPSPARRSTPFHRARSIKASAAVSALPDEERGHPVLPRRNPFKLAGDAEQEIFSAVPGDQLHPDRQPARAVSQR